MVTKNGGDDDEHTCYAIASKKWSWHDLGFLTLVAASNMVMQVAMYFGNVATVVKADHNFRQNRKQFAAEVLSDIGKL